MSSSAEPKTCAICLGSVKIGDGQAIFTAECSHSFHFGCIGQSVQHGNYICPVCRADWNILPFTMPTNLSDSRRPQSRSVVQREPVVFSDDEPLPSLASDSTSSGLHDVYMKAIPERPALSASESVSQFSVLLALRAPSLSAVANQNQRAPIDLVTVLDVSGSMHGSKLALLKRAVNFVIDNLGPSDRISLVSFATNARRILPLCRMTENGREDAKRAVNLLTASGTTNIVEGLKKGVQVLEERHQSNPVASIIFLSDGCDTCNRNATYQNFSRSREPPQYLNLLPASIYPRNRGSQVPPAPQQTFPVHAFGFGSDHDPLTMHEISDASAGTFSFIESYEMVQDAFASCIGGLLSVVTQELRIMLKSASNGVKINSIPSGRYFSEITSEGSQGMLDVGELYADEEKEFLINISIPESTQEKTSLLDIEFSYRDAVSNEVVHIECDLVEIHRPETVGPPDMLVNLEVDRQRNRLSAMESIASAQRMAEEGNLTGAQSLLSNRRSSLMASASGQVGDGLCMWLEAEMKETEDRMRSQRTYESSGRAYALANLSSHASQRATTRGSVVPGSGSRASFSAYGTPKMADMVSRSQQLVNNMDNETLRQE